MIVLLELNSCIIEAFPSNHLDAYRALDNPKFVFIYEADFSRKRPNAPDGLFERIEAMVRTNSFS
jgi:hypothetical protein